MAREALYVCFGVLKESNKSIFDSHNVRSSRVHIFSDKISRNSCISMSGSRSVRILSIWVFSCFVLLISSVLEFNYAYLAKCLLSILNILILSLPDV